MMFHRYLSTGDVSITASDGEDIGSSLSGMTYNAAIGAVELRAPRLEDTSQRAIPDLANRSPLHVFAQGRAMCLIHFEAVTTLPIEFDLDKIVVHRDDKDRTVGRDTLVNELVILRGARVELT